MPPSTAYDYEGLMAVFPLFRWRQRAACCCTGPHTISMCLLGSLSVSVCRLCSSLSLCLLLAFLSPSRRCLLFYFICFCLHAVSFIAKGPPCLFIDPVLRCMSPFISFCLLLSPFVSFLSPSVSFRLLLISVCLLLSPFVFFRLQRHWRVRQRQFFAVLFVL